MRAPEEELRRLQRENENLREEKEILKKKSIGHLLETPKVKYEFMENHSSEFSVKKMRALKKVIFFQIGF